MPQTTDEAEVLSRLDQDLAGLDALELAARTETSRLSRVWRAAWPKLGAVGLFFAIWMAVVWSGWRPDYVVPPPSDVFADLRDMAADGTLGTAVGITMRRAAIGYVLALVIGLAVGAVVVSSQIARSAVGSRSSPSAGSAASLPTAASIIRSSPRPGSGGGCAG